MNKERFYNLDQLPPTKKVLLIEPPFFRLFGYRRWHYPFTLVLVGSYLEELGHSAQVYDMDRPTSDCREYTRVEAGDNYYRYEQALKNEKHIIWEELRDKLLEIRPQVVCIAQSVTAKVESADLVAKLTKETLGENVVTILGGVHVNSMLHMYPDYEFGSYYDKVVTYIPNLIDRKPNKKLLVDYETYGLKDFSSVWTSSGCPNSCTFCCYSLDRKIVFRNIESIRSELWAIKDAGSKSVYFIDDSLMSYTKRFHEISKIARELDLGFKAGGRVTDLSWEKIERFVQDGGEKMYIGIESGSQRILDLVKKKVKIGEIVKRTRWLNEVGVLWSAFFMVGFPFETIDELKMTKRLIEEIKPTFISLNRFTPYPGTQIYMDYFMDKNIKFSSLFQQNRNSCVQLDDEREEYIEYLFKFVEEYNEG